MSTPCFYYYPDPNGSLETVDLGEEVSNIQETPIVIAQDAQGGDGSFFRSVIIVGYRVRITLERFGQPASSELERDLMTMQSHLQRGGMVGFSRDHSKTWAAPSFGASSRGDAVLYHSGTGFAAWSASAALEANDEVVIEDLLGQRDYASAFATPTSTSVALNAGIKYSYTGTKLIRWRDFYPTLYLPASQIGRSYMSHDGRRTFTMDITLEYSLVEAISLWGSDLGPVIQASRAAPALRDSVSVGPARGRTIGNPSVAFDPRSQVTPR